jgi:hypothetical protein
VASYINITASASSSNGAGALSGGPYYIAAHVGGGPSKRIAEVSFIPGIALNILVKISYFILVKISYFRPHFTVYAESSDNLDNLNEGQIAICDGAGSYSQAATQILLGADGSTITVQHSKSTHVRRTDSPPSIAEESGHEDP